MELRHLQFSVVITGDEHNPSILSPAFLLENDIVPKDAQWELEQPVLTSPMFALVRYANRIAVQVEREKLQVIQVFPDVEPAASPVLGIAERYVKTLPHVRYGAVGLNFQVAAARDSAEAFLLKHFVMSGAAKPESLVPIGAGLRFVYALKGGGQLRLSYDAGQLVEGGSKEQKLKQAVIANANFHRELQEKDQVAAVAACLKETPSDWAMLKAIVDNTLAGI